MRLEIVTATLGWDGWLPCVRSWVDHMFEPHMIIPVFGKSVLEAYQEGYEKSEGEIIGYLHDDLMIESGGWDARVMREFLRLDVGVVGFGGAIGHGTDDLYRKPFEIPQLVRRGFMSNMRTAEQHGSRFPFQCDVAVLDGFALFVRRELLDRVGGWPLGTPVGYFCYDYWLCCMARRHGYRIRMVGVGCDHLGGKSTGLNRNFHEDYNAAHQYIYEEFRDVLPAEVHQ